MEHAGSHVKFRSRGERGPLSVGWFVAGGLLVFALFAYATYYLATLP